MNVTYSEGVRQWDEGFLLAQKATERLEEILGPAAEQASAEWNRIEDEEGYAVFALRVRDSVGEVTTRFASDELQSEDETSIGLHLLWANLLGIHNHKQLEKLMSRGG